MKYTNEDFIRLMSEVERQGGEHLDATCGGKEVEFKMPDGSTKTHMTTGCEQPAMFLIPYDPTLTVTVPEPVLEVDPTRTATWKDSKGETRRPRRTAKTPDPTNPDLQVPEIAEVRREGEAREGAMKMALPVRVCAVDDNVGMWPRFRNAVRDKGTG